MKCAVLALSCLALAACGERKVVVGDCATSVIWRGETRLGTHAADRPGPWPPAERRVTATVPRCGDAGGYDVRLIQFRGVAPGGGLAQDSAGNGEPHPLFPSNEEFLQGRSHPPHDA